MAAGLPVFGQKADTIRFETADAPLMILSGTTGAQIALFAENQPLQTIELSDVPTEPVSLPAQTACKLYPLEGTLTSLTVSGITSLDVREASGLQRLNCSNNSLSALDVSRNAALSVLKCSGNKLTALDLSGNEALTELYCASNQLSSLDLSHNGKLKEVYCSFNTLTSLNIEACPDLYWLECYNNRIFTLDLSQNKALYQVYCYNNRLETLTADGLPKLQALYAGNNKLKALNVNNNTSLKILECFNNALGALNVDNCPELEYIHCSGNQLDTLDIFHCPKLHCLYAENNALSLAKNRIITQWFDDRFNHQEADFWHYTSNQHLYVELKNADTLDLRTESRFDDMTTRFTVYAEKNADPADGTDDRQEILTEGTDYTLSDGFLIFKQNGRYKVQVQNSRILAHCNTDVYYQPFIREDEAVRVFYHVSAQFPDRPEIPDNPGGNDTIPGTPEVPGNPGGNDTIPDVPEVPEVPDEPGGNDTVSNTPLRSDFPLQVYPNPCREALFIQPNTADAPERPVAAIRWFRLFDLQGRERLRVAGNTPVIDLKPLAPGIYVLYAETNDGVLYKQKIIKQ